MEQAEELRYLILAVQREGSRQLTEALRPLKLTPSQAEVIKVLQQYQPITLLQLGERLVCENGSPSRLVTSMVEAGWVEKLPNPDDGRAVLLRLTPKAASLLPELNAIETRFNQTIAELLSAETIHQLLRLLWVPASETESGQALLRRKEGR